MPSFSQWFRHFGATKPTKRSTRLQVESLETREVPTANLTSIADATTPNEKAYLVPLTLSGAAAGPTVNYTATADNPNIATQILTSGRTLVLSISGKDSVGANFTGDLRIRLFEDVAPLATGRIIQLAQDGFYNGLSFHRVIDNFVIQGGDPNGNGSGGSPLGTFSDEFNAGLTFNSPGLLAMANSGNDTNNSQFFITDIDSPPAANVQGLNFNHTIFGQLVSGFGTYQQAITTPTNSGTDAPLTRLTINTATVVEDKTTAVLRVSSSRGFTGSSRVTVTGDDGTGVSNAEDFNINFLNDTQNERAFLGNVPNVTTTAGTAVSFNIAATDLEGDSLNYVIRTPGFTQPANVSVSIDATTGRATLTPAAGFIGTIQLLAGVRDQTPRDAASLDDPRNFDTQLFTLTVTGSIDLNPESDTGPVNDDNVTEISGPVLTIISTPGQVVNLTVNNGASFVATETATPGTYTVTLPNNTLAIGPNTITGQAGSEALGSIIVNYGPRLLTTYFVPGVRGVAQDLIFDFRFSQTDFRNEIGVVRVDDESGAVGGVVPGSPDYIRAVLQSPSRQTVVAQDAAVGSSTTLTFNGGDLLVFFLIQNASAVEALARLTLSANNIPSIFFSLAAANSDGLNHVNVFDDPLRSQAIYAFEDLLGGGDQDYNDAVFSVRPVGTTLSQAVRIPSVLSRDLEVQFQLQIATKSQLNANPTSSDIANGEVGLFAVDDEIGSINGLRPGDPGYTAAALGRGQLLFANGAAALTSQSLTLTGGAFFGFYYIPNGTANDVLQRNPNNQSSGDVLAFFNFDGANPDAGVSHFRTFSPEQVRIEAPASADPFRFHFMGTLNGGDADFDDIVFTMNFNQSS